MKIEKDDKKQKPRMSLRQMLYLQGINNKSLKV